MFDTDEGYRQAALIDNVLNNVLQEYDIGDRENIDGYLSFLRTIETGIRIARTEFKKHHPKLSEYQAV